MNNDQNHPTEPLFAEEMLEKANIQASKLIEQAISVADELMERANSQAHALIEKANADAHELIKRATKSEKKKDQKANQTERELSRNANLKKRDLINTAEIKEKELVNEADKEARAIPSSTLQELQAKDLLEDAEIKAQKLVKEAVIQAKDLVEEADEDAKELVDEADHEAKDLVKLAAAKAKELVKVAARQSKDLIAEASLQTKDLVRIAALQAKDLIKEAAARYVEQKLNFINIAAHELRTPITSISLNVQFAEKQVAKGVPVNEQFLKQLRGPLDRLTRLLVYMVDMSLLERNLLLVIPIKTNLTKIIMECVEEFKRQFPHSNIIFINTGNDVELFIDPVRIHQVISNLIDNAVKYCGEEEIKVSIKTLADRVRVEVEDHGPGLSEKQQKLIFGTFQRMISDETIQNSGLGLGLPMSSEIIRLHKGRIGVQSHIGIGCTFFFELPYDNSFHPV